MQVRNTVYRKMGSHIFTDSLRLMGQPLAKRRDKVMENTERSLNVYSCSSVSSTRRAVTNTRGKVPLPPTSGIPTPRAHQEPPPTSPAQGCLNVLAESMGPSSWVRRRSGHLAGQGRKLTFVPVANGKNSAFMGDGVDPREARMRLTKSSFLLITVLRDPRAVSTCGSLHPHPSLQE